VNKTIISVKMSALLKAAMDLIFTPGSSLKLVPAINITIGLLLVLMASLLYNKIDTIHIVVMTFLSLGLLVSVNWFYFEFQKIKAQEDEKEKKS
jgi:hypothetical protein